MMILGKHVLKKLRCHRILPSRWSSSMSSSALRRSFLDFFADSPVGFHKIVPSSSLRPYNDPSLTFVNSGMSQFKSVFLGQSEPMAKRVANTQKCVRLGGKHNDISHVGLDGSHHTFFEMMGNWSFGDYFKWEAISMAWQLLTGPMGLPKEKLYVTYFGGDQNLKLAPDTETLEHWKSLGIPEDRILPFGMRDNFWEMAYTGPCGPCTEIHYDHMGRGANFVNKGVPDVVEVWNLVFMEYNRVDDQVLQSLDRKHVDTGLGLERLAAIKCGSMSNYDSDLFQPLLDLICKKSGATPYSGQFKGAQHLDTKYRILVDHSRMITASIADGIFPMMNTKVRSILRQALTLCQDDFRCDHKLLRDLTHCTVDILGDQYPEMSKNLSKVDVTLESEADIFQQHLHEGTQIKQDLVCVYPNANFVSAADAKYIYEAVNYLERNSSEKLSKISGDLGLKFSILFGFSVEQLRILAEVLNVSFNEDEFQEVLMNFKKNSKLESALKVKNIEKYPKTDTTFVQDYKSSKPLHYVFPMVTANVLGIQDENDNFVTELAQEAKGKIFLDKTCFYAESGGQIGDRGTLVNKNGVIFEVIDCQKVLNDPDRACHIGIMKEGSLKINESIQAQIDIQHRLQCMQNHSGAHLLNEALHSLLPLTFQNSFYADSDCFKFEFASFQNKIDAPLITRLEQRVHDMITENLPITRELKSSEEVFNSENEDQLIVVPGAVYPSNVSLIRLPNGVTEPCCGTHLHRTGDVQDLVILDCKSVSTGIRGLTCVTGAKALEARKRGLEQINAVTKINEQMQKLTETCTSLHDVRSLIREIREEKKMMQEKRNFSFGVRMEMIEILDYLLHHLLAIERNDNKCKMQANLEDVIIEKSDSPFLTHFYEMEGDTKVVLSKATKLYQTKPILLIVRHKDKLYGRACVPEAYLTKTFNAEAWLDVVGQEIQCKARPPRGQDKRLVCNMLKPTNNTEIDIILQAIAKAEEFAKHSI